MFQKWTYDDPVWTEISEENIRKEIYLPVRDIYNLLFWDDIEDIISVMINHPLNIFRSPFAMYRYSE